METSGGVENESGILPVFEDDVARELSDKANALVKEIHENQQVINRLVTRNQILNQERIDLVNQWVERTNSWQI